MKYPLSVNQSPTKLLLSAGSQVTILKKIFRLNLNSNLYVTLHLLGNRQIDFELVIKIAYKPWKILYKPHLFLRC